ncbi:ABC transporter permease subunit [Nocardia sp. NPDC055029]
MDTFLQFALLGLGAGGAYAVAGIGLVQIYRGSGVLNLSHGAIAFAAATLFVQTYGEREWPLLPAAVAAVALAAAIGGVIQVGVMHPLRNSPPLVRMVATLGVFAVLQQAVPLVFGTSTGNVAVPSFYPKGRLELGDTLAVPYDRLIVVCIAVALALALWILQRRTRLGLATTAVAENRVVAASLAIAPNPVAMWNWMLGSALAGLAGVILSPIVGVITPLPFMFLVIPALAAAMIGRFESFFWTTVGGIAIGVGQSVVTRYQAEILPANLASGWPNALPFLVIIVVLMLRGSPFPVRGEIAARLPSLGRRTVSPFTAIAVAALGAGAALLMTEKLAVAVTASAGFAIVGLSLVVLTGLAGQTSLAQMAIAGIGALSGARLSHNLGLPFPVVLALGVVSGAAVGIVFAAPAMRTRGPALAIATIGIGIAIESVVLNNGWFTVNGFGGTPIDRPHLGPLDINGVTHPQRYAAFAVVVLVAAAYAVANLRAGRTGRRLIAMRSSERATSAMGVSLPATKLIAFTISAALASLGGIVLAFSGGAVTYERFGLLQSLNLVIFVLIGGIGYVIGPIIGGALAPNGFVSSLMDSGSAIDRWLVLGSGIVLVLVLVLNAHGVAAIGDLRRRRQRQRAVRIVQSRPNRSGEELRVRNLTVRYGDVVAVNDLSLRVGAGEIVGLIGPNGAGKTSALDAITGFARADAGSVLLGDRDLSRQPVHARAASGLGRSFQAVETFDDLTVAENLAVACNPVRWIDWLLDPLRNRPIEIEREFHDEAVELGLDLRAMPDELSQGRRRILGVLRALAGRPTVLLLDEPAAGLDPAETEHLANVLRQVAAERKLGILIVEHDMSLVAAICDRVVAMEFGTPIVTAPTQEALAHPVVRAAYLGDDIQPSAVPATEGTPL